MPEQDQGEVRVEELTVGRHQAEEEQPERHHGEPVGDGHDRQPGHPGVPEELAQQGHRAGSGLTGAARIGLAQGDDAVDVGRRAGQQGDPGQGQDHADRDGHDLERVEVHRRWFSRRLCRAVRPGFRGTGIGSVLQPAGRSQRHRHVACVIREPLPTVDPTVW